MKGLAHFKKYSQWQWKSKVYSIRFHKNWTTIWDPIYFNQEGCPAILYLCGPKNVNISWIIDMFMPKLLSNNEKQYRYEGFYVFELFKYITMPCLELCSYRLKKSQIIWKKAICVHSKIFCWELRVESCTFILCLKIPYSSQLT